MAKAVIQQTQITCLRTAEASPGKNRCTEFLPGCELGRNGTYTDTEPGYVAKKFGVDDYDRKKKTNFVQRWGDCNRKAENFVQWFISEVLEPTDGHACHTANPDKVFACDRASPDRNGCVAFFPRCEGMNNWAALTVNGVHQSRPAAHL
ncbi:uncharacterized protein [Oscarella lobularis]|uniref:uncharacterized protein n=1 Tax=Oscarella lobularis TaxID=121494 RepID=UPI0033136F9B